MCARVRLYAFEGQRPTLAVLSQAPFTLCFEIEFLAGLEIAEYILYKSVGD